jgi:RNA polymerase sigma factor (TIGR02999 family)
MDLTYRELRRIAAGHMRRERSARAAEITLSHSSFCYEPLPGISLRTADLVHDAYLRLVDQATIPWRDRGHLFQVASHVMRQILIDRARKRHAGKRGGGVPQLSLDRALDVAEAHSGDLLALEEALARLEKWTAAVPGGRDTVLSPACPRTRLQKC